MFESVWVLETSGLSMALKFGLCPLGVHRSLMLLIGLVIPPASLRDIWDGFNLNPPGGFVGTMFGDCD